jgi:hypothetical protein
MGTEKWQEKNPGSAMNQPKKTTTDFRESDGSSFPSMPLISLRREQLIDHYRASIGGFSMKYE